METFDLSASLLIITGHVAMAIFGVLFALLCRWLCKEVGAMQATVAVLFMATVCTLVVAIDFALTFGHMPRGFDELLHGPGKAFKTQPTN